MSRRLYALALSLCICGAALAAGHTSQVQQVGDGNEIRLEQFAGVRFGSSLSEIMQVGNANRASVKQEVATDNGQNSSDINHTANGNSAVVEQRALAQLLDSMPVGSMPGSPAANSFVLNQTGNNNVVDGTQN